MKTSDGSIINRGKDRHGRTIWEVSVSLGRDRITGKRLRKTARVHGTKSDARARRDEIRRELGAGLRIDADKVTLSEWVETYMEARRLAAQAQPETLDAQHNRLKVICGLLDGVALKDVNAATIEAMFPRLRESIAARNAGKCSTTTLHGYYVALNACLKQAVNKDLILRNPCDKVEAPKVADPDRRALDPAQASRLLAELDKAEAEAYAEIEGKEQRRRDQDAARTRAQMVPDLSMLVCVRLGLATGMRLGEVIALQWQCVDTLNGLISVERGLSNYGRLKETKTKAGRRYVSIDPDTCAHLARWKEAQGRYLQTVGAKQTGETHVVCSASGTMLDESNFETRWREWRAAHGFDGLKYHELRHTQATLLIASGIDVKTVQNRLGHSSASITLDWYGHALPGRDRIAAETLARLCRDGNAANVVRVEIPKTA